MCPFVSGSLHLAFSFWGSSVLQLVSVPRSFPSRPLFIFARMPTPSFKNMMFSCLKIFTSDCPLHLGKGTRFLTWTSASSGLGRPHRHQLLFAHFSQLRWPFLATLELFPVTCFTARDALPSPLCLFQRNLPWPLNLSYIAPFFFSAHIAICNQAVASLSV